MARSPACRRQVDTARERRSNSRVVSTATRQRMTTRMPNGRSRLRTWSAILALPRLFVYDTTLLVAGIDGEAKRPGDGPASR
jgi:hypothetical protein